MVTLEELVGPQGEHEEGHDQGEISSLNFDRRVLTMLPMHHEGGAQSRMPVSREEVWEVADMLRMFGGGIQPAEVSRPCHGDTVSSRALWWGRHRFICPSAEGCVCKVGGLNVPKGGMEVKLANLSSNHSGSVLDAMWGESSGDQVCLGGGDSRSHGA